MAEKQTYVGSTKLRAIRVYKVPAMRVLGALVAATAGMKLCTVLL